MKKMIVNLSNAIGNDDLQWIYREDGSVEEAIAVYKGKKRLCIMKDLRDREMQLQVFSSKHNLVFDVRGVDYMRSRPFVYVDELRKELSIASQESKENERDNRVITAYFEFIRENLAYILTI